MSKKFDTEYTDCIKCPHCGYEDFDAWEVEFGPGLEGEIEHECISCGEAMQATRNCTVTYSTEKLIKYAKAKEKSV